VGGIAFRSLKQVVEEGVHRVLLNLAIVLDSGRAHESMELSPQEAPALAVGEQAESVSPPHTENTVRIVIRGGSQNGPYSSTTMVALGRLE
jgi:hypothetical protein